MRPEIIEVTAKRAFSVSKKYDIEKDYRYPFHLSGYTGCLWSLEDCIPGCRYCYARKMWKRYWRNLDHPYQLIVKTNYPELVREELPRMDKKDLPKIMRIRVEPYLPGYTELETIKKIGADIRVEEVKVKKLNYFKLSDLEPQSHEQIPLTQFV